MTEAFILCKRFAAWRRSLNKNRRPAHVLKLRVNRRFVHIVITRCKAAFARLSLFRTWTHFIKPLETSLRTSLIKLFASKRSNTTRRDHVLQATLCVRSTHFFTMRESMCRCVACTLSSMRKE